MHKCWGTVDIWFKQIAEYILFELSWSRFLKPCRFLKSLTKYDYTIEWKDNTSYETISVGGKTANTRIRLNTISAKEHYGGKLVLRTISYGCFLSFCLSIWLVISCNWSRIFNLYDGGGQNYFGRKLSRALWLPTTIGSLPQTVKCTRERKPS